MTETTTYRNALPLQSMLQEYRLDAVLGVGGFGVTYLGWDTHLEKHVAIKEYLPIELAMRALDGSVVPVTTDNDENYKWGLDRFILEARTLAKFSHPHIVRVLRYFEANGTGYMVMDYEKGESLSDSLKRMPQPDEARLKNILMPLLDGLQAVHASGFLHRDIKPANIFVRENGSPVLLDFGAARHAIGGATKSLTAVLTPGFAPLEQYSGDGHQGPWSDIYAMSGVLYRALTNDNPPDAVTRIRADAVPQALNAARTRYSGPFVKAIEWALAVDESQRPQSIAEWRRALQGERLAPSVTPTLGAPAATVRARQQDAARAAAGKAISTPPRRPVEFTPREPDVDSGRWRVFVIVACVVLALGAVGAWKKRSDSQRAVVEKVEADKRAAELRTAREEADRAAAERRVAEQREAELRAGDPRAFREEPARPAESRAAPGDAERLANDARMARAEAERLLAERRLDADRTGEKLPVTAPPPGAVRERPTRDRDERPGDPGAEDMRRGAEHEFRNADLNGNGYLDRAEVGRFPFIAKAFERVDTDGDSRISLQEFINVRRAQAQRFRKQ